MKSRVFLAAELGEAFRAWHEELLAELRARFRGPSWVSSKNVHLTLRFLGEVEHERLAEIARSIAETVHAQRLSEALTLEVSGCGEFGRGAVLWLGFESGDSLERMVRLEERLEKTFVASGFSADEKVWNPHVTVARNRRRAKVRGWRELVASHPRPPLIEVDELTLFSSELQPRGAVYRALERFALVSRPVSPPPENPAEH